jgi:peptidyl-prolyl cis-trans isomerase A (cyclophilin A)
MARTSDPDSALAQFFINHKYNRFLDYKEGRPGYAVFGKVISGLAIVDSIAVVETTKVKGYADVPVEPIRILSARLLNPEAVTLLPEQKKDKKPAFERPVPIR